MGDSSSSVEALVPLILLVGSFMYIYGWFTMRGQLDVLIATLVLSGSAVWLFSIIKGKK